MNRGFACLLSVIAVSFSGGASTVAAVEPSSLAVEVLAHEWRPDAVWERIGKTKFIWKATVRNNSDKRKRVYVYYDLLDSRGVPLARNVTNRYLDPHQTVEITADSYILSEDLPKVRGSRATAKIGL